MGTSSGREAVVKTGDVIEGRYRIIKTLGQGGMGTVFLAEHTLIKRRVAMKVLHPELATDADVIERFMNEARAAGTLGHPNIVESTDMGFMKDHVPYIVFEYLEGTLLTDEIYRVGGLPLRRVMRIATQIASALGAAHNAQIVHRDLKSDNVFLTDKDDALDHVKVLDFGISRFLRLEDRQRGVVMGTPEFMAPEQITNPDKVDRRADIYALGVILYEMLTARRPFSSFNEPQQLLHQIVNDPAPPLMLADAPHGLSEMILSKLLAKDPADRYQSMSDVEAALEAFVTHGDGTALPRRRSAPIATVDARDSALIPQPAKMRDTPWPVDTLSGAPSAADAVSLPPAPRKRPYALYGIGAVCLLVGVLGLAFGLRGGHQEIATAPSPAPVAQPLPAAAVPIPREPQKIEIQLDADAPNAHFVFRRRVAAAPTKLQLTATDVVELVEVSAPGYKTERFWLTFDRPTHLKAHLAKGTGLAEASEEETLVALGEVATTTKAKAPEVAAAKPDVVAAAVAVKTVARAPEMAPRKIGHATADATPPSVSEPIPAPTAVAKAELPIPEPPSAKKAEAPAVVAKKPDPIEPAKAEPTKMVEPPKPEVVAAAVAPEPDLAKPLIDNATVSSVVGTHRPEVLKCFVDGKKQNRSMKGTLSLQLQVDNAGKVHRAQVKSTLDAPMVAACVVKAANGWRFPSRTSADLATVTYPFTIN